MTTRDVPGFRAQRNIDLAAARVPGTVVAATNCKYAVTTARNRGVARMIRDKHTHIWFVDNDTLVQEDALELLLEADANVATGCTPIYRSRGYLDIAIVRVRRQDPDKGKFEWYKKWFNGIRKVGACGAACLLIKREVFDKLEFPWFRWPERIDDNGEVRYCGEDIDFCDRLNAAGLGPITAHGNVRCGHLQTIDAAKLVDSKWRGPQTLSEQNGG